MAKYIDADKLYAEMEDLYEHHIEMRNFSADGAVADCLDILAKQPIADVVEVVRCGQCKDFEPHGNGKGGICRNRKCKGLRYATDFCSYGERKD